MFSTAFFIKLGLSLGLGLLAVRQLRGLIQKGITRSIPMKERMAEDFLQRLSNRSTIVGIALVMLITSASYGGLSRIWPKHDSAPSFSPQRDKLEQSKVDESQALEQAQNEETSEPRPKEFSFLPTAQKDEPAKISSPVRIKSEEAWYIQIGAFAIQANAQALWQTQQQVGGSVQVFLAETQEIKAPWKILLGPFPSAQAARNYRDQHGIPGYPRNASGLRLL